MSGRLPEKRELDSIYLRVKNVEGKWENRCLTDIPIEKIKEIWADKDRDFIFGALEHLHQCLRQMGDDLDIVCAPDPEAEPIAEANEADIIASGTRPAQH